MCTGNKEDLARKSMQAETKYEERDAGTRPPGTLYMYKLHVQTVCPVNLGTAGEIRFRLPAGLSPPLSLRHYSVNLAHRKVLYRTKLD